MSRLLWAAAGFLGGISFVRNAHAMTHPAAAACFLVLIAACGVCWFAAYRGKSVAVATAVATAVAQAKAEAKAQALAVAQGGQVQLHADSVQVIAPIAAPSVEELASGRVAKPAPLDPPTPAALDPAAHPLTAWLPPA